jgi:hypothetical protein
MTEPTKETTKVPASIKWIKYLVIFQISLSIFMVVLFISFSGFHPSGGFLLGVREGMDQAAGGTLTPTTAGALSFAPSLAALMLVPVLDVLKNRELTGMWESFVFFFSFNMPFLFSP